MIARSMFMNIIPRESRLGMLAALVRAGKGDSMQRRSGNVKE